MVHQARSVDHIHSLHLTVSTYQLFDWTEYFQKVGEMGETGLAWCPSFGPDALHCTIPLTQQLGLPPALSVRPQLVPRALSIAAEEDPTFREGLPLHALDYMGVTHSSLVRRRTLSLNGGHPTA